MSVQIDLLHTCHSILPLTPACLHFKFPIGVLNIRRLQSVSSLPDRKRATKSSLFSPSKRRFALEYVYLLYNVQWSVVLEEHDSCILKHSDRWPTLCAAEDSPIDAAVIILGDCGEKRLAIALYDGFAAGELDPFEFLHPSNS